MTKLKKAAILIPTYNRAEIIDICLQALSKNDHPELFDIYVVDNGSKDNTKQIASKYKNTFYVREEKNVFISHALNNAFFGQNIVEKYEYVVVLANDVLTEKNTVSELVKFMDSHPEVCLSAAVHYEWDSDIPRSCGIDIHPITSLLINYLDDKPENHINHFHSMFIIRAKNFHSVGGFDHVLFPMVYEEPDLGDRMLDKNNIARICMTTRIWHPITLESSKPLEKPKTKQTIELRKERLYNNIPKAYLFFRNRIIYISRHSAWWQFLLFYFIFNPLIFLYYLPSIELSYIKYALLGIWHGTVFALTKNRKFIEEKNQQVLGI